MPAEMPLFPLPLVAYPHCRLPLQIFEPRYLDMIKACMANETPFAVMTIDKQGAVQGAFEPALMPVGTSVRIVDFHDQANGLLGIVCEGIEKVTVNETRLATDQLLLGSVTSIAAESTVAVPTDFAELVEVLLALFDHPYVQSLGYSESSRSEDWLSCSSRLGFYLAYLMPLPMSLRYKLLAMNESLERLAAIQSFIDDVNGFDPR